MDSDTEYMVLALKEAEKGRGSVDPNPMVGALIVEGNRIAAKGFHQKAGGPHAEIEALKHLGRPPKNDAILYITLEPCSTHGKTPPCTDAILASGIKRVVVGAIDPNPAHQGRGIQILIKAGIEVRIKVLEKECTRLNESFNERMRRKSLGDPV